MALQMRKMPDMEEFRVLLKEHGLKSTHQRLAVHEAMMRLGHASADMVTEEIHKAGTVSPWPLCTISFRSWRCWVFTVIG